MTISIIPNDPSWFSRIAYADAVVSTDGKFKSFTLDAERQLTIVAETYDDYRDQADGSQLLHRVTIQPSALPDSDRFRYEISPTVVGSSDNWTVTIERAFEGRRVGFGAYHFTPWVNIGSAGSWSLEIEPDAAHDVIGKQDDSETVAKSDDEYSELRTDFTVRYVELESWRDMLAIVFSTLLGLGLALFVEGLNQ